MALTVANYIRTEYKIEVPASALNVVDMEIPKPIIVPQTRPEEPQFVRIEALADLKTGRVAVEYGTYSTKTKRTDKGAKCTVEYGDGQAWLDGWARSAYLVRKRISALERGVGMAQRIRFSGVSHINCLMA